MGHVNDGGESRLRRGFATGAAAAFGGGGVGRCVGGDLLWRAERVRAMVRDVCAHSGRGREHRTASSVCLFSERVQKQTDRQTDSTIKKQTARREGDTYDNMSSEQGKQRDMEATPRGTYACGTRSETRTSPRLRWCGHHEVLDGVCRLIEV